MDGACPHGAEKLFGMDRSQYKYCSVCRRNHDKGRGHIFSKQHKAKLNTVLSKFGKKASTHVATTFAHNFDPSCFEKVSNQHYVLCERAFLAYGT